MNRLQVRVTMMLCLLSLSLFSQEKQTIAVLDFEAFGINEFEVQSLTNRTRTLLVRSGQYQVVERGKMNEILNEQGFQQSGCTTEECIVEVGQLLGVKYMLGGSIGRVGETFTIDMRMIDIQTGKIFKSASYDVEGKIDDVLKTGLPDALDKLLGTKRGKVETASVTITFEPADAVLFIEEVPKGGSPVILKGLTVGQKLYIQIKHPDYEAAEDFITLKAGVNPAMHFTLNRLQGQLSVSGKPGEAKIKLSGLDIGQSPLVDFQYPVGDYNLVISKPEYQKYFRDIRIDNDNPLNIDYQLEPLSKSKALVFSAIFPGAGQLYQRHSARGLLLMASALGAGWMIMDTHSQFLDDKDDWMTKRDLYNNNIDQPELWVSQKEAATNAFNVMKDTQKKQYLYIGALGLVWSINVLDIIF